MLPKTSTGRNIFAVAALGIVTTIVASSTLFSYAYTNNLESNRDQIKLIAETNAGEIEHVIRDGIQVVGNLETTLSTMKEMGEVDRGHADRLMENLLKDTSSVVGLWAGWEPNAFDGQDKLFAGKQGHDKTGRFLPFYMRNGDTITRKFLTDYDTPGVGEYYMFPRDQNRLVVAEPYSFAVDGKQVMTSTIALPIVVDGKVHGVAGVEVLLAKVSENLAKVKPMGTGFVGLVTGMGNIISHPDSDLLGKSIKDADQSVKHWSDLIARPGVEVETVSMDGEAYLSIAYPVQLTPETTWYAIISVPKATVFAQPFAMAKVAAAIVILAALLLGIAGWIIARKFIGRITRVIEETGEVANGRLDVAFTNIGRSDEIGRLSQSLDVLLRNNKEKLRLEQEAEVTRVRQETERQEQNAVTQLRETSTKFVVDELGNGLARLAGGDMTVRLCKPFPEALETVRASFNESVGKLQHAMISFSHNAVAIHSASSGINATADDLARRTEQQAASVEETAAALEEITTSVGDSAARAREAGELVARTKLGAEKSGQIVRSAVEAMSSIARSSQSISSIIGVIDDIAFQTNLLALNAGVEAARAGEAGKGFAVVAQEVRELAQRSATAAREIKDLITTSGGHVKHGVDLVGETGAALETILGDVSEISRNVQAIVKAAHEQSIGLQEINSAVNQIDQVTQQNAAKVAESASSSQELVGEVRSLHASLSQFTLDEKVAKTHRRQDLSAAA